MTTAMEMRKTAITVPTMAPVGRARVPREELGEGGGSATPEGVEPPEVEEDGGGVVDLGIVTKVVGCADEVVDGTMDVEEVDVVSEPGSVVDSEMMTFDAAVGGEDGMLWICVIVVGPVKVNDTPKFTLSP
jgi:hypothetical protein